MTFNLGSYITMKYFALLSICTILMSTGVGAQEPLTLLHKKYLTASTLLESGQTEEGIHLLEDILESELPSEEKAAQRAASTWQQAAKKLCFAYAENGRLRDIMPKFESFDFEQSCFCQRVRFAQVLLEWERHYTSRSKVSSKSSQMLAGFAKEFPAEPSYLEMDALLDFVQSAGCIRAPLDERIAVNQQCLESCLSMLDATADHDSMFQFFRSAIDASNELAKFYVRGPETDAKIRTLMNQIDRAAENLLAASEPQRINEMRAYTRQAKGDVKKYIETRLERRRDSDKPTIFESQLLDTVAPKIDGILIQGSLPDRESDNPSVILLNYWVPYSSLCVADFQRLKEIQKRWGSKGLEVVGVSSLPRGYWDENTKEYVSNPTTPRGRRIQCCKLFVEHHGLTNTQIIDQDGEFEKDFEIRTQPTYVLIDRKGVIKKIVGRGQPSLDVIEELLADLL